YDQSPDAQLRRDRADLERLRQSPTRHDAAHQEARLERQIASGERAAAQAEAAVAKTEAERVDAARHGSKGAGPEATHGDQVPMRDLVGAVGDLLQTGVRPELLQNFLKTGRSGGPDTRAEEIAAAREWKRRLDASPEMQAKLLANDPEIIKQFTAYAIYAPAVHEQ